MYAEILAHVKELSSDTFGHHVVRATIKAGTTKDITNIIEALLDDVIFLSMEQFGSQIIEQLMELTKTKSYPILLRRFVSVKTVSQDRLSLRDMMKSQYANFPVQKCLKYADKEYLQILVEKIDQLVRQGLVEPD